MKTDRINIRIEQELKIKLKTLATKQGRTLSNFITNSLKELFKIDKKNN